jgi:hypothetical protein
MKFLLFNCLYISAWSYLFNDLRKIALVIYESLNTDTNPDKFLKKSVFKVRSVVEIIKMLDIYSRLDYICDWCKINNLKCPVDSAMIYERRYTLMWLT